MLFQNQNQERERERERLEAYLGILRDIKLYKDEIPERTITKADPDGKRYKCQFSTFHTLTMLFSSLETMISDEPALQRIRQFNECVQNLSARRDKEKSEAVQQGKSPDEIKQAGKINQSEVDEINAVCDYFIEYLDNKIRS